MVILAYEVIESMTEVLSLGQYYSIDCIIGPIPTGVSVSWILTNGSIDSNRNTLVISSILPSHKNTQYRCMFSSHPSCFAVVTFRVRGKQLLHTKY